MSPLKAGSEIIETVTEFIYLGQLISMDRNGEKKEVRRRMKGAWCAFMNNRAFYVNRSVEMKLKRKLFNQTVVPAALYASETWATTKEAAKRLGVEQRRMERMMVGVSLLDRRTNEWLRGVTKVTDLEEGARRRK